MGGVYVPRTPRTGVRYGVVRAHLTEFVGSLEARTDGVGLCAPCASPGYQGEGEGRRVCEGAFWRLPRIIAMTTSAWASRKPLLLGDPARYRAAGSW